LPLSWGPPVEGRGGGPPFPRTAPIPWCRNLGRDWANLYTPSPAGFRNLQDGRRTPKTKGVRSCREAGCGKNLLHSNRRFLETLVATNLTDTARPLGQALTYGRGSPHGVFELAGLKSGRKSGRRWAPRKTILRRVREPDSDKRCIGQGHCRGKLFYAPAQAGNTSERTVLHSEWGRRRC